MEQQQQQRDPDWVQAPDGSWQQRAKPTPRSRWTAPLIYFSIVLVAGLLLVLIALQVQSKDQTTNVATATASTAPTSGLSVSFPPTTAPITTAPTTTEAVYMPTPADFSIEVIEVERSCFGSAGCNITYRINPTYIGATKPPKDLAYTVLYDLKGAESPKTGNFEVDGEQVKMQRQDSVSTPVGAKLTATPTRVLPA